MSDIDLTEAIEAAADVVRRNVYVRPHETVIDAAVVPHILTAALPHIQRQVREQVADEVRRLLPGVLASTVADEFGWLSDAQDALPKDCTFNSGNVCFQGEGSIDIFQVGDYAASIARGDS